MRRRELLKAAAAVPFFPSVLLGREHVDYGWRQPDSKIKLSSFPEFTERREKILLQRFYEVATRTILMPHRQETVDCTSQAWGLGIDFAQAIQAVLRGERWVKKVATELLHIGGREIIGGRERGGVAIAETAQFIEKYGNVYRAAYPPFDFTEYSLSNIKEVDRANKRKREPLLKEAEEHKAFSFRVRNAEQACQSLANLCPVIVGSDMAFNTTRDSHGFVTENKRKSWSHAWLLIGFDTRYPRPGGLLISSWGPNWVTGPRRDQPEGSIWVDMEILDDMITRYSDSAGISYFQGVKNACRMANCRGCS